mgnify:CR=1 FL=1
MLSRLLKDMNTSHSLNVAAKIVMCDLLGLFAYRLGQTAINITRHRGAKTVSEHDLNIAVKLILQGELKNSEDPEISLVNHAVIEGSKAVSLYSRDDAVGGRGTKAGLEYFNPTAFDKYLRGHGLNVGNKAGVYGAAVLEYITVEVLALASEAADEDKKQRITPRHIQLGIRRDREMNLLFRTVTISEGGVVPHINRALLVGRGLNHVGGNTVGITKPAIIRMMRRAGVKSASGLMYEESRGVMHVYLQRVLRVAKAYTEADKRSVISEGDVRRALHSMNRPFLGIGVRGKMFAFPAKKSLKSGQRRRKGSKAISDIKHAQKGFRHMLPRKPVRDLIRSILDMKFRSNAYDVIHSSLETYMIGLFAECQLIALHSRREGILPKDMQLARRIRGERS